MSRGNCYTPRQTDVSLGPLARGSEGGQVQRGRSGWEGSVAPRKVLRLRGPQSSSPLFSLGAGQRGSDANRAYAKGGRTLDLRRVSAF